MRKLTLLLFYFFFLVTSNVLPQANDSTSLGKSKIKTSAKPINKLDSQNNSQDTLWIVKKDTVYIDKEEKKKKSIKQTATDELNIDSNNPLKSIGDLISFWKITWSIIILIFAYYLIKFIIFILDRIKLNNKSKYIVLKNAAPFIRIIGWTLAILLVIKGVFNPPEETIFAVLASAGIAIGFAAQDILKNIFGGIMILFDRPFQIGDKIEVGDYYGEVVEIGLRSTRIVTSDDSLVSIPNSEVVNTAVSNSNAGDNNCQVVAEIYLPIDIDTDLVRKIATETAQISRYIYLNKPVTVLFVNEVKERRSYLKMRLKAYVSDLKHEFSFKSDMTEIFLKELLTRKIITKEEMV